MQSKILSFGEKIRCQAKQLTFFASRNITSEDPKFLITGANGQLGLRLAKLLRKKHTPNSVITSDIVKPSKYLIENGINKTLNLSFIILGPFLYADVLDFSSLQQIVVNYRISHLIHFSALLSAACERDISSALRINIDGFHNILKLCEKHKLQLFMPSSIAAFAPDKKQATPDVEIKTPRTIYGISKLYAEMMGDYYFHKHGLSFRSLRLPGILSYDSMPGGGTTDYAVHMFHHAISGKPYQCYLHPDTRLPMMYIDDCINAIMQFLEIPDQDLSQRTYNIFAMSFTPSELAKAIQLRTNSILQVTYKPDKRQEIADSWPQCTDDTMARKDWGWKHKFDFNTTCDIMLTGCQETYNCYTYSNNFIQVSKSHISKSETTSF